jgi:putative ABC transport system substrate-binding protein
LSPPALTLTGLLEPRTAARGVELSVFPVRAPEEITAAVDGARAAGATALNVLASYMLDANRKIILDQCAVLRLPAIYQWPETAEESGLTAYGPRCAKMLRQLARQVVKVLRGAKRRIFRSNSRTNSSSSST